MFKEISKSVSKKIILKKKVLINQIWGEEKYAISTIILSVYT